MAFDAGMLSFVVAEINNSLSGGKVEKVCQPSRDEIVLIIRGGGESRRLLINAGSRCPRINITSVKSENPAKAPMMCMMFRKHLQGSIFTGAEQLGFERAARLSFDAFDDMGFRCKKHIIVEMMGKYSNIIFTDDSGKIISLLRQIDFTQSLKRQLLPGMIYEAPPAQDKTDPLTVSLEDFEKIRAGSEQERPCDKFIMSSFSGIAPVVAREIAVLAGGFSDAAVGSCGGRLSDVFFDVTDRIKAHNGEAFIVFDGRGKPVEYCFMPLTQYGEPYRTERCESFGELLDRYFEEKSRGERVSQKAEDILHIVSAAVTRITKKLAAQQGELADCDEGEKYRLFGDLITANIYRLRRGMDGAVLENYENGEQVNIPLDTRLTPAQNAQKYYKKYAKAKSARQHLTEQIAIAENELVYIKSVQDALSRADGERELAEIRSELYHSGYASKMKNYSEKKQQAPSYLTFKTSGGYTALCGKNNTANDWLTFRHAEKNDWWFHAKGTPGSHVILECAGMPEPPAQDFTEAAMIAAVYSKAGEFASADVDYTNVRQVKKPPNAKPGFVIYHTNWSATVTPDREAVEKLKIR